MVAHWYAICFAPGGPGFKSRQGRELLILISHSDHRSFMDLLLSKIANEKIISQIVGVSEVCDQNGDKLSKKGKSCIICIILGFEPTPPERHELRSGRSTIIRL